MKHIFIRIFLNRHQDRGYITRKTLIPSHFLPDVSKYSVIAVKKDVDRFEHK